MPFPAFRAERDFLVLGSHGGWGEEDVREWPDGREVMGYMNPWNLLVIDIWDKPNSGVMGWGRLRIDKCFLSATLAKGGHRYASRDYQRLPRSTLVDIADTNLKVSHHLPKILSVIPRDYGIMRMYFALWRPARVHLISSPPIEKHLTQSNATWRTSDLSCFTTFDSYRAAY